MKVREIKFKYDTVHVFELKDSEGLLIVPQIVTSEIAQERFGDRKVFYQEDHDEEKFVEILVENEQQSRNRKNL